MEKRILGKTDLEVTRLGFGGARITGETSSSGQVESLLNAVLDRGINFVDTAACYGDSEELIGRSISHRRDEYVLATKCGHATGEAQGEDWSERVISESIDRSLRRLGTDRLDLVQLHTCSAEVLRAGEATAALLRAREAGKTRYVGYSGDGDNALEAIRMGVFDTLQTSLNPVDQQALNAVLPAAQQAGMGVIAKRPVANGAIGRGASPYRYADVYWERAQHLQVPDRAPENPLEFSLRFTLSHQVIDTAIVGTTSAEHARQNIQFATAGSLPDALLEVLYQQFHQLGEDWKPQG